MTISKAFFALIFSLFVAHSHAYTFYVGGSEGWVLHSESYSDWASRNRFQANHTLVFKYTKGEDSVLEVSQQDFDLCNLDKPIEKMDTGYTVYASSRPSSFFFVSGTGDRCKQGEKLSIVVTLASPSTQPYLSRTLITEETPAEETPTESTPEQPSGSGTSITPVQSGTPAPTDTDSAPNNPTRVASVSFALGMAILHYGLFY